MATESKFVHNIVTICGGTDAESGMPMIDIDTGGGWGVEERKERLMIEPEAAKRLGMQLIAAADPDLLLELLQKVCKAEQPVEPPPLYGGGWVTSDDGLTWRKEGVDGILIDDPHESVISRKMMEKINGLAAFRRLVEVKPVTVNIPIEPMDAAAQARMRVAAKRIGEQTQLVIEQATKFAQNVAQPMLRDFEFVRPQRKPNPLEIDWSKGVETPSAGTECAWCKDTACEMFDGKPFCGMCTRGK